MLSSAVPTRYHPPAFWHSLAQCVDVPPNVALAASPFPVGARRRRRRSASQSPASSRVGRIEDALTRRIQHGVVVGIGLLGRQPLRPARGKHSPRPRDSFVAVYCIRPACSRPTVPPPSRPWDGSRIRRRGRPSPAG